MRITEVESTAVSIPLDDPVAFATREVEARDYAVAHVRTDEGIEGLGYTLGYDASHLIADAITDVLAPMIEGEDPRDTERLWREMFDGTVQIGRKGLIVKAISVLDIALWDIRVKQAGQPLYKHLGGYTDAVPAYASGGYYRDEKGTEGLRAEMQRYVDRGHDIMKMKVGGVPPAEEVERVQAVRETIGDDRTLLLDANGAWSTEREAVDALRRFGEFDPYFIEEPVMPDRIPLMATINDAIGYSVAAGELEFTRYGFRHLLETDAVDVVQADATVVGGVTEWLNIAKTAATFDVPIAPHFNWNLHTHLVAAVENGLWMEYFYEDSAPTAFDDIVEDPLVPEDGMIRAPDRPGHGVSLDRSKVDEYRI